MRSEPEIRKAKARRYVVSCNSLAHEAPWTSGRTKNSEAGGLYRALELAQFAYEAHGLPYEPGLLDEPVRLRRFRWIYDETAENFVNVLDTQTDKRAAWKHFYP